MLGSFYLLTFFGRFTTSLLYWEASFKVGIGSLLFTNASVGSPSVLVHIRPFLVLDWMASVFDRGIT